MELFNGTFTKNSNMELKQKIYIWNLYMESINGNHTRKIIQER